MTMSIMPRSLVFLCGFGAVTFYLWVLGVWNVVAFVSGLLSTFFMLYVFMSAMASERAQRLEDVDAIDEVLRLVRRSEQAVAILESMAAKRPNDERALVILRQLGANMARFTSGYRRYLKDDAAVAAGEAENAMLLAQVSGVGNIAGHIAPMRERIAGIRGGMRDVDDPRLVAARRKI